MISLTDIVKRSFDIAIAVAALILAMPVMLVVALCIRWNMGTPVLFRQSRPGVHRKPFTILKFRTMKDGSEPDAERITRLGSFLRRTSLDELPELWNVVCGEMSLVGPRPLLTEYLDRYSSEQMRRHEVLPGITGWAQINGRNAIGWEKRLALDVWYVDHHTLWLDAKILFGTLAYLCTRRGISHGEHATMPPFCASLTCEDQSIDTGGTLAETQ